MTNDNNLSVSRIEERKSLQLPRREASGVSPRRLHAIHGKNGFMALAEQYGIQPKNRSAIAETLKTIRDQHRHLW